MTIDKNKTTQGSGEIGDMTDQAIPEQDRLNPKDFMRERRPELFSDSQVDTIPQISRAVLENHLNTLTSRKQEFEFEHFCRKLAEKEICPNLRVQTGPTGGGDSKVDPETYPVGEAIAERWYIGSPQAGKERWAFAFSAKKDWKPKVKSDVESILSTNRDYKLIYFITNQFARDKDRAACEDRLSNESGVSVNILDRSWIVDKVLASGNQHLESLLAALGIDDVQEEKSAGRDLVIQLGSMSLRNWIARLTILRAIWVHGTNWSRIVYAMRYWLGVLICPALK